MRIFAYISWRVFHILTEPVPFTFVCVNRRNNKARIAIWARRLHCNVDLRIQMYTEPVPLKCGKIATNYPSIYGHFYSVWYCCRISCIQRFLLSSFPRVFSVLIGVMIYSIVCQLFDKCCVSYGAEYYNNSLLTQMDPPRDALHHVQSPIALYTKLDTKCKQQVTVAGRQLFVVRLL